MTNKYSCRHQSMPTTNINSKMNCFISYVQKFLRGRRYRAERSTDSKENRDKRVLAYHQNNKKFNKRRNAFVYWNIWPWRQWESQNMAQPHLCTEIFGHEETGNLKILPNHICVLKYLVMKRQEISKYGPTTTIAEKRSYCIPTQEI